LGQNEAVWRDETDMLSEESAVWGDGGDRPVLEKGGIGVLPQVQLRFADDDVDESWSFTKRREGGPA